MGFRFRRSIRVAPGLRLNIGKSGVSASVGGRGAHVTIGHDHTRTTVSAPSTGISYTTTTGRRRSPGVSFGQGLIALAVALAVMWWFGWFK